MLRTIFGKRIPKPTNMKRRLIIHIGLHKTGSTSLQYLLHDNMQQLYDLGFLYPGTGRHPRSHVQHSLLARAFRDPEEIRSPSGFRLSGDIDRELMTKALLHEIALSGRMSVILSSEEFSVMDTGSVDRLYDQLDEFDVTPVVYVRNFAVLASALYQTFVTYSDVTEDFADFKWRRMIRADLPGICRDWASRALNGKIIVRNYDAPGFDIIADFALVAGIDMHQLSQTYAKAKLNRTLKPAIVIILRELRAGRVSRHDLAAMEARLKQIGHARTQAIMTLLNSLQQDGIDEGRILNLAIELSELPFREPQSLLTASQRAEILDDYEQQFKQLKALDFVELDRRCSTQGYDRGDSVFIGSLEDAIGAIGGESSDASKHSLAAG